MVNESNGVVEFRFYRPEARQVALAGDFNDWRADQVFMRRDMDGYWSAKLMLPTGVYKFRYCADGVWYTDYAAFGVEPGRYGMDSVVRVAAPTLKVQHAADATAAA